MTGSRRKQYLLINGALGFRDPDLPDHCQQWAQFPPVNVRRSGRRRDLRSHARAPARRRAVARSEDERATDWKTYQPAEDVMVVGTVHTDVLNLQRHKTEQCDE